MRGKTRVFTETEIDEIVSLYTVQELNMRTIGVRFNCSAPTIRGVLVAAGVTVRPRGRRPNKRLVPAEPVTESVETTESLNPAEDNEEVDSVNETFPPERRFFRPFNG